MNEFLKKGVEKANMTKTEVRKRKAEILKDEIKEAEKMSVNKEAIEEAVKAAAETDSPIKKNRGRPKKTA